MVKKCVSFVVEKLNCAAYVNIESFIFTKTVVIKPVPPIYNTVSGKGGPQKAN